MWTNNCVLVSLLSIVRFGYGFTDIPAEETHFTQSIIHTVFTSESECDTNGFVPFRTKVNLSQLIQVDNNCECGVHDQYKEQTRRSNEEAKPTGLSFVGEAEPFQNFQPLVVPGNITDVNQFPFIVALVYRLANGSATHFCGGTLISSKLILTATHCLQRKIAEKTEVWLNERDLLLSTETDHPTLKLRAARFIPHPEYNPLMAFNDISLIELSDTVDISKGHLRPICLPQPELYEPLDYATTGITAGWGKMGSDGPKSNHLRHVDVPLITNRACNEDSEPYFHGRITSHMICAGDLMNGGPDSCPGDSGGPLFIKHDGRFILIGIVSWGGKKCSLPRTPGVYTRVSRYLRWINKIDAETKDSTRCK